MARTLVSVDEGLNLPQAVQDQLKSNLNTQFSTMLSQSQAAATSAASSSSEAGTARDQAIEAANQATAPTDNQVASLMSNSSSATAVATQALIDASVVTGDVGDVDVSAMEDTGFTLMPGYKWGYSVSGSIVSIEGTRITRASTTMAVAAGTSYPLFTAAALPTQLIPRQLNEASGFIHYGSGTPLVCQFFLNTSGIFGFRALTAGTLGVAGANILVIPTFTFPIEFTED